MVHKVLTASFAAAWEMLIDFPVPVSIKNAGKDFEENVFSPLIQMCFPVVGVVAGLILFIFGGILSLLSMKISGAVIFAITLTFLTEFKDSFRSLGAMVSLFDQLLAKKPLEYAMINLDNDVRNATGPLSSLVLVLSVLLKLFAFGMMFYYGFYYWIILVLVLSFTIQGHLAAASVLNTGLPLVEITHETRLYIWGVAAFFVLFILFKAPYPSLIAFAVAFVFANLVRRFCEIKFNGVTIDIISLSSYIFELFTLLLGVLFLCGS
ncbi:MAG: adenosylcobinamide-GDP ribazoletransferase [Victivallaceae bacterium]